MQRCNNAIKKKNDLEYGLYYYKHTYRYADIKRQYDSIDMSKCNEYHRLKNVKFNWISLINNLFSLCGSMIYQKKFNYFI